MYVVTLSFTQVSDLYHRNANDLARDSTIDQTRGLSIENPMLWSILHIRYQLANYNKIATSAYIYWWKRRVDEDFFVVRQNVSWEPTQNAKQRPTQTIHRQAEQAHMMMKTSEKKDVSISYHRSRLILMK